jgi:meiotically up-regulated gene 157 (Mug157) protein
VPSNLFAVTSLRQLAEMAHAILHDDALANDARLLPVRLRAALRQHAVCHDAVGTIWAYEVDGFGSQLLMDDANVPSLLGLPYLESSPDKGAVCADSRVCAGASESLVLSWSAGEGIGGPHEGKD